VRDGDELIVLRGIEMEELSEYAFGFVFLSLSFALVRSFGG
jgi:hypothetical protein